MSEFKKYERTGVSELRPYIAGEELLLAGVSISKADMDNGSPRIGDHIARNPKNHEDKWLVSAKYVKDNLALLAEVGPEQEAPSTFKTRLADEIDALEQKLGGLATFLTTDGSKTIDPEQLNLLRIQEKSMDTYLTCIKIRMDKL